MRQQAIVALALALLAVACDRRQPLPDTEWTAYGLTDSEQRFSALDQIDERSVGRLGLAWSVDFGTLRGMEATPIVKDGVMYVTSAWSLVYAIDARTGRQVWTYDPHVPKDHAKYVCCDVVNRGVAYYRGRVYLGTLDGRLVALDAKTGAPAWDVQTTPRDAPYAITGAPRIANGRVVIGNAGSEYAVRGYVSAYDPDSGRLIWRSYMVPGDPSAPFESDAMRRASATWSGKWWKGGGGGNAWDAIVYDPEQQLVIVGTGNGSPWYEQLRSEGHGDNLYVASIVALRADTGEIAWHYQTTPGDNWDYDATQPLMLATLTIGGRERRVVMQANKNGFFYVIDRADGALISAKPYAEVTWATGIDATGRPIEAATARSQDDAVVVYPGTDGAHNWHPLSFSPRTGLVYFGVADAASLHAVDPEFVPNVRDQTIGRNARYSGPALSLAMKTSGRLVAWDPIAQREVWRVTHPDPKSGGTLVTGGNLVFQGRADGALRAYRATDGSVLWQFDAPVGIAAPPMTYAIDGTQYVAVLAGWGGPMTLANRPVGKGKVGFGTLLTFTLGGSATLPRYERRVGPVTAPEFEEKASPAEIAEGGALYVTYCMRCHGVNVASGGSVPDLRYSQESTHRSFDAIVRGGERRFFGMPSFADDLTTAQVRFIHAYVLEQARRAARETPR